MNLNNGKMRNTINLDSAILHAEWVDKEEEIFDYFRNASTDSIKAAMKELDSDDISEIDVRLVRIKFHSELGN